MADVSMDTPLLFRRPRSERAPHRVLIPLIGFAAACYALRPSAARVPRAPALSAASAARRLVRRARVEFDCAARMPLFANVTLELDMEYARALGDELEFSVRYAPLANTSLAPLWTAGARVATNGTAGGAITLTVVRLRPASAYAFEVYADPAGEPLVWEATATTCSSGFARLDAAGGPFVRAQGARLPSYEMATFATTALWLGDNASASDGDDDVRNASRSVWCADDELGGGRRRRRATAATGGTTRGAAYFEGLVAIDAEGFVVWLYHAWKLESWDFLPDGDVVLQADAQGRAPLACEERGTGRRWAANSQLQQISPLGQLRAQYVSACTGDPLNYNQITHECRVDATSARHDVLTTRLRGELFPNVTVRYKDGPDDDTAKREDTFFGSEIVRWNREDNVIEPLYNLFDLASPRGEVYLASDWNLVDSCACSGGASRDGVEYHHVSSVAAGATANILVASRELSTIWSLGHDGSGVQWTLSSQLESDFLFERSADAFFQPHDVTQLANGNLLVMDDGSNRPGCYLGVTKECFSRAVMYSLDPACDDGGDDADDGADGATATTGPEADVACNRTARVVWQFEFPLAVGRSPWREVTTDDVYNFCGGSISKLPNGNYLIAFTSMDKAPTQHNATATRTAYAWEVDADGRAPPAADDDAAGAQVRTALRFPMPHDDAASQNSYRVVPWHSISGESSTSQW